MKIALLSFALFLLGSFSLVDSRSIAADITYTYDGAGRLIKADYGGGVTIEYSYDKNGNLIERIYLTQDPVIYVSHDGDCQGKAPCFSKVQDGIDWARDGYTVKVREGFYGEKVVVEESRRIELECGYNGSFSSVSSVSTVRGLEIRKGTLGCKGTAISSP